MAQMAQMAQLGGNTKTPNLKRCRLRRAVFTLNNYTSDEVAQITHFFEEGRHQFIFGKEVGENGTPHLQGYVEFSGQISFSKLKKLNSRIHWEKAKAGKKANVEYCSKEGDCYGPLKPFDRKKFILEQEFKGVIWKKWQKNIIDLINSKPDRRSINWFWEPIGNIGKSFLCKYLALTKNVILASGKSADIFNQIKSKMDEDPKYFPEIILIDIPRTQLNFINYSAIESIKNGLIYSGKYEGGQCIFPCPHVLIFANEEPEIETMSEDRWNIKKLIN